MSAAARKAHSVWTELRCMAPHPLALTNPNRFGSRVCGTFIIELPLRCQPTGRVLDDSADVRANHIPARCPRCSSVTEYQILTDEERS